MLKAIVLYEVSKCGKTHTLNKLFDLMIRQYEATILEKQTYGNGLEDSDNNYALLLNNNDEKKIAIITTAGDSEENQIENYKFVEKFMSMESFKNYPFYWFTASRTQGGSANYVSSLFSKPQEHVLWIRKGCIWKYETQTIPEKLYEDSNEHTASMLIDLLNSITTLEEFGKNCIS